MRFLYQDTIYGTDAKISVNGMNYVLRRLSPAKRAELGVTVLEETAPADSRFYYDHDSPRPVEDVRKVYIQQIKDQARGQILSVFPEWKQANMTARGVEILSKLIAGQELTAEESVEKASLELVWAWIKSVRDHSNTLEQEVNQTEFEDLKEWQPHDWPEWKV